MATYHIKKDTNSQYFWILVSDNNGKTVCMSSESYNSKQGVKQSISWTQVNGKTTTIKDLA